MELNYKLHIPRTCLAQGGPNSEPAPYVQKQCVFHPCLLPGSLLVAFSAGSGAKPHLDPLKPVPPNIKFG